MLAQSTPYAPIATKSGELSSDMRYLTHEFSWWPHLFGLISLWEVANVRDAINSHDAGYFYSTSSLSVIVSRFPTVLGPLEQRLGIPLGIERSVFGGDRGPARRAKEAFAAYMKQQEANFGDVFFPHAMMGFSVLHTHYVERAGELVAITKVWPSVATRYVEQSESFEAQTLDGWVRIQDGDGHWTMVGTGARPHRLGAIRAIGEDWAKATHAMRDEAQLSAFLGKKSMYAILPEGDGKTKPMIGTNTDTGKAVAEALKTLARARGGGLFPAGTKVESTDGIDAPSAQLFEQIFGRAGKNHAKALLGTDGTVESGGGGVYVSPIFGRVLLSVVRRDLTHAARAYNQISANTTKLNYDGSVQAPEYRWLLPDPAEAERKDAMAKAHKAVADTISGWKASGLDVTDEAVQRLAKSYGVEAPPLAVGGKRAEIFAYHLSEKVVAPDQVLESLGLPALPFGVGTPEHMAQLRLEQEDAARKKAAAEAQAGTEPGSQAPAE